MTKMTYVNAIEMAINGTLTAEGIEKLEALKASLEKRNANRSHKPTKTQRENEVLKEDIFAFVSENGAKRAMDVAGHFGIAVQKASALLNQLAKAEALEKFTEKRVTFFRVVEGV